MCVYVYVCVCVCKSHGIWRRVWQSTNRGEEGGREWRKGGESARVEEVRERGVGEESLTPVVLCVFIDCKIALSSPSFRLALEDKQEKQQNYWLFERTGPEISHGNVASTPFPSSPSPHPLLLTPPPYTHPLPPHPSLAPHFPTHPLFLLTHHSLPHSPTHPFLLTHHFLHTPYIPSSFSPLTPSHTPLHTPSSSSPITSYTLPYTLPLPPHPSLLTHSLHSPSSSSPLIPPTLPYIPVKHLSFIGVSGDEAIHFDCFVLSNPVAASLSLDVVLGIPVRVVDDDSVCSGEVDPQSPSTSAQQEDKPIRVCTNQKLDNGSLKA